MPSAQAHERIRLVHCIGSMRIGGAETQLAELICRLPRDRFEQSLVLFREEGPLVERIRAAGCEVVNLDYNTRFRPLNPRTYYVIARTLVRFIGHLRRRPHILHAQLYWANNLGVVAGRLAGVPSIVTTRLQLSDYKQGKPWLQWVENAANLATTAVLVNSEAVRRDAFEHERWLPKRIERIYNGVVLENFEAGDPAAKRREFGLGPEHLIVVAVANLHPYKGHEDLLRAAAILKDRFPNLRLVLPGRDAGVRERLEELRSELGLVETVQLIGERHDVPALLAMADVAVHPSHQEGFSNAILEAMTAGKPAVVTSVGGNAEAVADGENGFVIPPRSPERMAEAIGALLADPALRQRMGEASRRRIEQEFSMQRNVERTAQFYETLVSGKSNPK